MSLLNTADALFVGADAVTAAFVGADEVWGGGGGFDPLTLSPHVLLNPDTFGLADGGAVASATDTSGNADHFTQGSAADRPTIRGGASLLNGHLVVEHDGVSDYLAGPDLSALTSGHAFIVVKIDNDPPAAALQGGLWEMGHFSSRTYFPFTDGNIYEMFGTTVRKDGITVALALTSWRIYEVRSAANDYEIKLDGASLFSTASNTVAFAGGALLGAAPAGAAFLDGRWAYFALFPALSAGDATAMRTYLQERFAL